MTKDKTTIDENAEFIEPPSYPSSTTNLLVGEQENAKSSEMNPVTRKTVMVFGEAMTFAKSVARFKIHRGESISGTAKIDPLTWKDINTMKWWPGLLAIVTSYAIAPCITSLFFIGIDWKQYATNPSRWWQCGVYCSALWLTSIQLFGLQCIQIKVRSSVQYKNFTPSLSIAFFLYLSSALFAFMIWAVCWIGYGRKLIHPLGQSYAVALGGILGTAIFQTKFLVPEDITFKKDIFFLCLLGQALVPIALFLSLGCMLGFIYSNYSEFCLIFFPISRVVVDMLMRLMISFTNTEFLEPIFIHISALCNNIFFIYSIAHKGPSSYSGIVIAGVLNSTTMYYYYLLITSPVELQLGLDNQKTALMAWWKRTKPEFPVMSTDERKFAMNLRSKMVYLVILDMASQLILPWWLPLQLALIMFRTPANTSMVTLGFDTSWGSFIHRFNTALILNGLDIINMSGLTYFIRRKFPLFHPFRILHMIFEQFGLLPISGIMFILISIICFFISDCGIDPDQVWEMLTQ